jgi:transposase-like protein
MIGECSHEKDGLGMPCAILISSDRFGGHYRINEYRCKKCDKNFTLKDNHSFTTDADMMKVFRWLVDNGKWNKFKYCCVVNKAHLDDDSDTAKIIENDTWLHYNSERFNVLAAMAKMEGVI